MRLRLGRTKVAIIGYTDHRALAPYNDDDWEIWGLNDLYYEMPSGMPNERMRWFQLHPWSEVAHWKDVPVTDDPLNFAGGPPHPRDPNHVPWLADAASKWRVYLMSERPEVPDAHVYPKDDAYRFFSLDGKKPNRYFTNSISWMLGLAIMEGFKEIGLYGVDMMMGGGEGSEYGYQRPSCEFFLGWARGAGITIHLPDESDLLKTAFVYGDESGEAFRKKLKEMDRMYGKRLSECNGLIAQGQQGQAELTGARNTLNWIMRSWMPGDSETETRGRAPTQHSDKELPALGALTRMTPASDGTEEA